MGRKKTDNNTNNNTNTNGNKANFEKANAFVEIVILQEIFDDNGNLVDTIEHRIPKDIPIYNKHRVSRSMINKTVEDSEYRFKALARVKVVAEEPEDDIEF